MQLPFSLHLCFLHPCLLGSHLHFVGSHPPSPLSFQVELCELPSRESGDAVARCHLQEEEKEKEEGKKVEEEDKGS